MTPAWTEPSCWLNLGRLGAEISTCPGSHFEIRAPSSLIIPCRRKLSLTWKETRTFPTPYRDPDSAGTFRPLVTEYWKVFCLSRYFDFQPGAQFSIIFLVQAEAFLEPLYGSAR